MTIERVRFETDVPGIWGLWPMTPLRWSYSSLRVIEACPSRWMLSRADYPDIWEQRGYPPLPVVAAMFGNVVHGVVERLAKELGAAGVASPGAGDVVTVLGSLGGWRTIVLEAIEGELARLAGNPRVNTERIDRVRDQLVRRAPEAVDQVKVLLGSGAFPSVNKATTGAGSDPTKERGWKPRTPAGPGAHAELEVIAEALRLTGRIDLLVVDDIEVSITDFKTGLEQDDHDDQVRLYALLWSRDSQVNPAGRLATKLQLAYPAKARAVAAPDDNELQLIEETVTARVQAAESTILRPPPAAVPTAENCQYCSVKHLCDAYWSVLPPAVTDVSADQWFDFEGRILRQNGSKSWFAETLIQPTKEVLLRTAEPDVAFEAGRCVRLLGVRRSQDPDDPERLVVSMVGTSEWYPLAQ